jgi:hypothetical protein
MRGTCFRPWGEIWTGRRRKGDCRLADPLSRLVFAALSCEPHGLWRRHLINRTEIITLFLPESLGLKGFQ